MQVLADKVAIVTGASSGIGRATALLFARMGAAVVAAARRKVELKILIDEIETVGGVALAIPGDVRDETYSRTLVQQALQRFGRLDIAFNNAGTLGPLGSSSEVSAAAWQDTLDTNLTGAFYGAKYQVPAMLERGAGSLIFTSTFVGQTVGFPGAAAYAASKAGVVGLAKALAAEYGPRGIRVNALLAGGTDTPMARQMNSTPEQLTWVEGLHALKRIAKPEEIAQAVLFLASDASSFVTGSALFVDGGVSINRT